MRRQRIVHAAQLGPVRQPRDLGQLALALEAVEELEERVIGLAAQHPVGVLEGLLGPGAHVRAAHEHGQAALAELVGERVGARRRRRDRRDADQVGVTRGAEVDPGDVLDIDADRMAELTSAGGHRRHAHARHAEAAEDVDACGPGFDERDREHACLILRVSKLPGRLGLQGRELWRTPLSSAFGGSSASEICATP